MNAHPLNYIGLQFTNKTHKNVPKPKLAIIIIIFLIISILLFLFANCLTNNQATVLGVAGSTIFAISVFFLSRSYDEHKDYINAKKNAYVFHGLLEHLELELVAISENRMHVINYPSDWLAIYINFASYLKYDYFRTLIKEFSFIDEVNELIKNNNISDAQKIISLHWKATYSNWQEFSLPDISHNIQLFSKNELEEKHWLEVELYREFFDFIMTEYIEIIHAQTISYLKLNGGHCDERDAISHVYSILRSDEILKQNYSKYLLCERYLGYVIFNIYCGAEKNGVYRLCWGELSLLKEV